MEVDNLQGLEVDVNLDDLRLEKREEKDSKKEKKALDKDARKLARKNARIINIISAEIGSFGMTISEVPSKWIVVWGLGVAGGHSKETIRNYLKPHPLEIRYVFDKSYCIAQLSSPEDGVTLKQNFHGKNFDEKEIIYIGFLDKEPMEESKEPILGFLNNWPPGLTLIPNFITPSEEVTFIKNLSPTESDQLGTSLKKRWVRHFGYVFRYGTNDVDFDSPLPEGIPEYITSVLQNLVANTSVPEMPDQITVNHYLPGQGIPPHVDTHSCFEGPIVSLSVGSDTVMEFRRGDQIVSVLVPARSLLVMDEASRYGWTHCIPSRTFDIIPEAQEQSRSCLATVLNRGTRISLTLRKLRRSRVCQCSFPEMCDSQKGKITDDNASDLEAKLVHEVYEKIAPHFDETRHTPWPRVMNFVQSIDKGSCLLDVGCGNGKYFNLNKDIFQVGTDMSSGLLEICREKDGEVLRANALKLPFRDRAFQAVICIAVLHHLATKERRQAALQEMLRVLEDEGQALVYVWAKDQRYEEVDSNWASKQSSKELANSSVQPFQDSSFLPIHNNDTNFPRNDMLVPWVNVKNSSSVHHRYYHVFSKGELEDLVSELAPSPTIVDSYYDQGNWVVRFQKHDR